MFEQIVSSIATLDFWGWWILGIALVILEVFAPSTFFLWMGIAAGLVGVVAWIFPGLRWEYEWLLFALISVISIIISRLFLSKNPGVEDNPTLNQRGAQYIGRRFTLSDPIRNGRGKIHVDDSQWAVEGPDMEAGDTVIVTGVDGTLLIVDPVDKK
ncbi:NfeD family protein [Sneathiella sp.]|uniref:NfeD family protein n=1 Tax=Sneathiella sp. TaxID=1964365 RepID=UPI00356A5B28